MSEQRTESPRYSCWKEGCPGNHPSKYMICQDLTQKCKTCGEPLEIGNDCGRHIYRSSKTLCERLRDPDTHWTKDNPCYEDLRCEAADEIDRLTEIIRLYRMIRPADETAECPECHAPFKGSHFPDCKIATGMQADPTPAVHEHLWSGGGPDAYCVGCGKTMRDDVAESAGLHSPRNELQKRLCPECYVVGGHTSSCSRRGEVSEEK